MTLYILRHAPNKTLGHLVGVLEARKLEYRYVDLFEQGAPDWKTLSQMTGLIILGGEMNVDETTAYPFLLAERALIQHAIEDETPVFGICLGAQLIARSLGAPVEKNLVKEIGWTPITLTSAGEADPVLSILGSTHEQFQWHEDRFELPVGAVHLARSMDCGNQAFRIGETVYGVQFHPEMTLEVIEDWLRQSRSLSQERKAKIWEESQVRLPHYQAQNSAMFNQFWQQALG